MNNEVSSVKCYAFLNIMKRKIFKVFLVCVASFLFVSPMVSQTISNHFTSSLGFTYDFASDFTLIDPDVANHALHARESQENVADKHSSECAQVLEMGGTADYSKSTSMMTFDLDCLGYTGDHQQDDYVATKIAQLGEYGMTTIQQRLILSNVKSATFKVGGHPAWGMYCSISPKASAMPPGFLARMIFPLHGKMVEITMTAKRYDDLVVLMNSKIIFTDGSSSALFPAEAVKSSTPIPAPQ
jgi:hypothetical protein